MESIDYYLILVDLSGHCCVLRRSTYESCVFTASHVVNGYLYPSVSFSSIFILKLTDLCSASIEPFWIRNCSDVESCTHEVI